MQDTFKAGIEDMKNKKWSVSAAQLNAEIETLSKSCLSTFNERKHEGDAVVAAVEKLHTFMELETLKMLEVNTKKAMSEQQNVQDIVQGAVARMKSEVDSEVRISHCFTSHRFECNMCGCHCCDNDRSPLLDVHYSPRS